MERSKQEQQIIKLGEALIKELKLERSVDTLSRWIIHYIAEKITFAKTKSNKVQKRKAENECFEAILKLWDHRWHFPNERQPLGNFAVILTTLKRLNPDERDPFFLNALKYDLATIEKENPELKEIFSYTKLALEIDKIARIWIEFALREASIKAKDTKVEKFLSDLPTLQNDDDITIIRTILDFESTTSKADRKKYQLEKLNKRISELEKFTKINEILLTHYRKELIAIQNKK
jgi:hypothetical protein